MNWDQIEGKWNDFEGRVRQSFGKLTDDDTAQIEGKRQRLAGKLQERYGWAKEKVDEKIDAFLNAL
tara:strand:+ start:1336 stop:1533 length:198 start_codon:yes stop_codon:yes gene_type:complete